MRVAQTTSSSSLVLDRRGRCGPPIFTHRPDLDHVLPHDIPWHMFGDEVSRIIGAQHFCESEISFPQSILYPQIGSVQMANLAESSTSAYFICSRRFGQYPKTQVDSQIFGQGLESDRKLTATADPSEFSLSREKGHSSLGGGPVLRAVPTIHRQSSRCRSSSRVASGNVGIHMDLEVLHMRLKWTNPCTSLHSH